MDCQSNEARLSQLKMWREEHKKTVSLLQPVLNILIATKDQSLLHIPFISEAIDAVNKTFAEEDSRLKEVELEYKKLCEKLYKEKKEKSK